MTRRTPGGRVDDATADTTPAAVTAPRPRVAIVADDLIWASRLKAAVERAGGTPAAWTGVARADGARAAVVDLGLRRGDGVAMIETLVAAGMAVIAVGQHEDVALRKRALAAGASRVYSYNKLFTSGPEVIARWLRELDGGATA